MTQPDPIAKRWHDNRPISISRGRLEIQLEQIIEMIDHRRGDPAITFDVQEDLRHLLSLIRGEYR